MNTDSDKAQRLAKAGSAKASHARDKVRRSLLGAIWDRMLETEIIDHSVGLAGKAFTSFFPLVITVAAFLPTHARTAILTGVADRFGLHGNAYDTVRSAFESANDIRRGAGLLGLVLTIFFASSFTTALERIYLRAWRQKAGGSLGPYVRGSLWVLGYLVYLGLLGVARHYLWDGPVRIIFFIVAFSLTTAVWWYTAWLMLARRVRLRALLPSALVTGALVSLFVLSSALWMPMNVSMNQAQYGFFGITLALITWFSGAAICLVIGACAGPVLAEDPGQVGRFIRGPSDEVYRPDFDKPTEVDAAEKVSGEST